MFMTKEGRKGEKTTNTKGQERGEKCNSFLMEKIPDDATNAAIQSNF